MIWDARKLDDYHYHRRRIIAETAIIAMSLGLLVLRLDDIGGREWRLADALQLSWGAVVIYFAFLLRRSIAAFQRAAADRGSAS